MYKVIVAHPHQQHSYYLATGLDKAGVLYKYITTVYQRPGSLTTLLSPLLKGNNKKRALSRRNPNISNDKVIQYCELFGLFYLFIMRITKNNKKILDPYNRFVSKRFGKKVAKYAIKNNVDAVVCFDTECLELFSYLKKKAPKIIRVMDASAINRLYLKKLYLKDMELYPEFANRLKLERPELFAKNSDKVMRGLKKEIYLTQYFLVPSNLVSDSFIYSQAKKKQMIKCPYGVDVRMFLNEEKSFDNSKRPLKVVYVGGIKELKGVGHLLKAFQQIDTEIAELTIVGAGNPNDLDIVNYMKKINFIGSVVHSEMPNILKQYDVFVFPSLGDSFGLSVLEGMASGLPAIVSENAGISEYITNNNDGFVIPAFSEEKIIEYVNWFYNNPDKKYEMSKNAINKAKRFTWEKYYDEVAKNLIAVINKERS